MAAKRVSKKIMKSPAFRTKVAKVMREMKHGELHSGSKNGPIVTSQKQAVAIAMSAGKKAAAKKRGKRK